MEDQIILQLAPNDCEGDDPADSLQQAMNYTKMILQLAQNDCEGDDPAESLQPVLNYTNLTNDICRLVVQANEWSSTVIIPQDIDNLDISPAAMGASSSTPIGATKQPFDYPR
jgi:hypothetical protein